MCHRSAGIRLECKRLGNPARTEVTSEGAIVALRRMGEAMEEPMDALEHGARSDESAPREQRCADAGLRGPSGMQPFRPGALRQVLDDARRHAGGNAERIDKLFCVQAQRGTHASCRSHRAEDGCRMEPGLVNGLGNDRAQTAHDFSAHRSSKKRGTTVRLVALTHCQHRRHNHCTGVDGAALERIVKVLAMGRGAIDEGSAGSTEAARMADGRAWPLVVATGKSTLDVVLVARGHAKTHHVYQKLFALLPQGFWQAICVQSRHALGQVLGNGYLGQFAAHRTTTIMASRTADVRRRTSGYWQARR